MTAFVRLFESGKADLAYPTPLALYGIRQFRAGRRVGTKSNVNDITSPRAKAVKNIRVGRFDHFDDDEQALKEVLIEDHTAGPAETACCRIDFAEWLRSLSRRYRRIATTLATGETTTAAARTFGVSPGRISQVRRELFAAWNRFPGEAEAPIAVA